MSQRSVYLQSSHLKIALRGAALGILSLTMMACGATPQAPGTAFGTLPAAIKSQMLPCMQSATELAQQAIAEPCTPPDPAPDPTPAPAPTPAAPSNRPDITPEMAASLVQAGLIADPYSIGQTYSRSCDVTLYTRNSGTTTCLLAGLKSTTLRSDEPGYKAVRINLTSQHNCSYDTIQLPDGGTVQSLVEVDTIYGRAIDSALKVGNVDLAVKLGQLRDYHKTVISLSSDSPVVQVIFYAHAGPWWTGRGGNCNGTVTADFVLR